MQIKFRNIGFKRTRPPASSPGGGCGERRKYLKEQSSENFLHQVDEGSSLFFCGRLRRTQEIFKGTVR
jgi:hypothetical protein